MTLTMTEITPQAGQTWRDRDPRKPGRTIKLLWVGEYTATFQNARGELRTIRTSRLRPIGRTKGYELEERRSGEDRRRAR
jgi:hypothetical protein